MKALLLAATLAIAGQAIAGEDSTHRWGAGGTGPAWYDTPCGLGSFPGPVEPPDPQRCSDIKVEKESAGRAKSATGTTAPPAERTTSGQNRPASSNSN
jgi:hypothetical protein